MIRLYPSIDELITINEEIESRVFKQPIGQWFTIAALNSGKHESRCQVHFMTLVYKLFVRESDHALLILNQDDPYAFCWQALP